MNYEETKQIWDELKEIFGAEKTNKVFELIFKMHEKLKYAETSRDKWREKYQELNNKIKKEKEK